MGLRAKLMVSRADGLDDIGSGRQAELALYPSNSVDEYHSPLMRQRVVLGWAARSRTKTKPPNYKENPLSPLSSVALSWHVYIFLHSVIPIRKYDNRDFGLRYSFNRTRYIHVDIVIAC